MKAAQINQYGDADVITLNDIDTPTPTNEQILVKVAAVSLNPFDTTIRAGYMKDAIPLDLPVTLGGDFAGTIAEVGSDVTDLAVGDRVFGQANVVAGNSGAFAEYTATKVSQASTMPSNLDFTEAASLPLVGVSALQALTEHLSLQRGQKLFIHGGAGGIGSIAIQIAHHIGAHVTTTAKAEDTDYVTSLGADAVIDYTTTEFHTQLRDFDAVFDTVGGDDFAKSLDILKSGGTAVSMIAAPDEDRAKELGVTAIAQATRVTSERLAALTSLVESGVINPQIAKVYPLDEIVTAFTERETGHSRGKIVLTVA